MFGSSSPVPYYPDNIFAKQFPYNREGMKSGEENNDADEEPKKETMIEGNNPDEESTETEEETKPTTSSSEKKSSDKKKKEGFEGLTAGSFTNEQYIGYLANVKTGGNCGNTSNGYSTSTGYLCLSPDELRYLQSRGGNATTKGDF